MHSFSISLSLMNDIDTFSSNFLYMYSEITSKNNLDLNTALVLLIVKSETKELFITDRALNSIIFCWFISVMTNFIFHYFAGKMVLEFSLYMTTPCYRRKKTTWRTQFSTSIHHLSVLSSSKSIMLWSCINFNLIIKCL